jgi:1-acyl-sn-glycerol-3-phosphate acyltransferase
MTWIISLAAVLLALLLVGLRVRFWLGEGRKMQESGYLAPAPSIFAKVFWAIMTRLMGYFLVGPIKVIGRHNLKVKGRRIFAPNHTFPLDFDLVAVATRGASCRYMTKTSELKGLRGAFGAWTGAIPVNTKVEGGGEAALNASIESLVDGPRNSFLIFPQGALLDEIKREDFRTGFARLAHAVYAETEGEPCFVIPMALLYLRDPQCKPFSDKIFGKLRRLFGKPNYGAVIVIGEAIPVQDLPTDPAAATDVLFERIRALHAQAVDSTKPRRVATF